MLTANLAFSRYFFWVAVASACSMASKITSFETPFSWETDSTTISTSLFISAIAIPSIPCRFYSPSTP